MDMHAVVLTVVLVGVGVPVAHAATGKTVIKGTTEGSSVSGAATLTDTPNGLKVSVQVTGVTPGLHAIHIHETGACTEAGKAAGGHYNPDKTPHGFLPKDGPTMAHSGDMGNITVGSAGTGALDIVLPGVALTAGAHTVAGRAIILHEKVDDFGQPAGNAGGRIGCGVIETAGQP